MLTLLKQTVLSIPHFWWITCCLAATCAGQIGLLRILFRQRENCLAFEDKARTREISATAALRMPTIWPTLLSAICPIAIATLVAWTLEVARGLVLSPPSLDPEMRASRISAGLEGLLNVVPWGVLFFVPSILMAATSIGLGVTIRARARRIASALELASSDPCVAEARLGHHEPSADSVAAVILAYVLLGSFPVVWGAWSHIMGLSQGLSSAPHDPEQRMNAYLTMFSRTHAAFVSRASLASAGIILATALAVVMVVRWHRRRPANDGPTILSWQKSGFWSLVCLLAALACFVLATPYRAENNQTWPDPARPGGRFIAHEPKAPQLEGPDDFDPAPILWITRKEATLDGRVVDPIALEEQLRTTRATFRLLHPFGSRYLGRFIVVCTAETSTERLSAFLAACQRSGHNTPVFAFTRREEFHRPILGDFTLISTSAGIATIAPDSDADSTEAAEPDVEVLPTWRYQTYRALAGELVRLRRMGKRVVIKL
jgi:hypothetical protein